MNETDKILSILQEARERVADEARTAGSRELSLALTNIDQAMLWRGRDLQLKKPATNTPTLGDGMEGG